MNIIGRMAAARLRRRDVLGEQACSRDWRDDGQAWHVPDDSGPRGRARGRRVHRRDGGGAVGGAGRGGEAEIEPRSDRGRKNAYIEYVGDALGRIMTAKRYGTPAQRVLSERIVCEASARSCLPVCRYWPVAPQRFLDALARRWRRGHAATDQRRRN